MEVDTLPRQQRQEDSMSEDSEGHLGEQNRRLKIENVSVASTGTKGINRSKTCPMYIRLFCRLNGHHTPEEYLRGPPLSDEVIVYTWWDASLSELSDLIKEVNVECRRRDARFSFSLVYTDFRGAIRFKPLGVVSNGKRGRDDGLTLESLKFVQGDFIDVAIFFGPIPTSTGNGSGSMAANDRSHPRSSKIGRQHHQRDQREEVQPYKRQYGQTSNADRREDRNYYERRDNRRRHYHD